MSQSESNNSLANRSEQPPLGMGMVLLLTLGHVLAVLWVWFHFGAAAPQVQTWLAGQVLLIPTFALLLAMQMSLRQKWIKWLVVLMSSALSVAWGSMYPILAGLYGNMASNALWLSLLLILLGIYLFRGNRVNQWGSLLAGYLTLGTAAVIEPGLFSDDQVFILLMFLAMTVLPTLKVNPKPVESQADNGLAKLQKEYDDLQVAFTAQDAAIAAETTLRQAVEQSLRHANQVAEAASRSKTEFMATIGHEIRTPLNGIIPILEMLEASGLNQEQLKLVKTASHSSFHLLRIINDVLDFSKAEVGKLEIESIEIDLHELVYSVTDLLKQPAENKGLAMKVVFAPGVPRRVRGDSLRLKQIITNLLSNALKFTEKGGISLEISMRHEHVREIEMLFTIRDTGIGMTDEVTRKLFQSFTQADASTTRNYGGTGLGLAICKRLVELMGGEIGVQSVQGKGSTFWFVLPLRKSLRDVPALHDKIEDVRVLYFLKNSRNSELYNRLQLECKIKVETCHELTQAVRLLQQALRPQDLNFFDLVVVDVMGSEFTAPSDVATIKKAVSGSLTQIVVVNALPSLNSELKDAGANSILLRPFNEELFRLTLYRQMDIGLTGQIERTEDNQALLESMFNSEGVVENVSQPALQEMFHAKVLLVEDNPVNRQVGLKMLESFGLEVEQAEDGYEALKLMKSRHYDIVFMDCLMPRMDGFEATGLWRNHENENPLSSEKPMVIVAITANAMRGDWEKCIAAKMDDYLPKPITRSALAAVLNKWLPDDLRMTDSMATDQKAVQSLNEPSSISDLIDQQVLSELQQVMGEDYKNVIHSYLQHSSQLLTTLKHKAQENDALEVMKSAHSFKSSSKNVGAVKLGDQAQALEQGIRQQKEIDLEAAVQKLIVEYDHVASELQRML